MKCFTVLKSKMNDILVMTGLEHERQPYPHIPLGRLRFPVGMRLSAMCPSSIERAIVILTKAKRTMILVEERPKPVVKENPSRTDILMEEARSRFQYIPEFDSNVIVHIRALGRYMSIAGSPRQFQYEGDDPFEARYVEFGEKRYPAQPSVFGFIPGVRFCAVWEQAPNVYEYLVVMTPGSTIRIRAKECEEAHHQDYILGCYHNNGETRILLGDSPTRARVAEPRIGRDSRLAAIAHEAIANAHVDDALDIEDMDGTFNRAEREREDSRRELIQGIRRDIIQAWNRMREIEALYPHMPASSKAQATREYHRLVDGIAQWNQQLVAYGEQPEPVVETNLDAQRDDEDIEQLLARGLRSEIERRVEQLFSSIYALKRRHTPDDETFTSTTAEISDAEERRRRLLRWLDEHPLAEPSEEARRNAEIERILVTMTDMQLHDLYAASRATFSLLGNDSDEFVSITRGAIERILADRVRSRHGID